MRAVHRRFTAALALTAITVGAGAASLVRADEGPPEAPAKAAATDEDVELVFTPPVETTLAMPGLRSPARVWIELLRSAKRTIDIEQMYIISATGEPLEGVLDALEEAGRRGVKIRFLHERKMLRASDPATISRLQRIPHLRYLNVDFAKVIGRDAIIHAKFMVVDGERAYVGSQNFDWRSLEHVHELGLRVAIPKIAQAMHEIFEHDFAAAERLAAWDDEVKKARKEGRAAPPPPPPSTGMAGTGDLGSDPVRLVASPPELLPAGVGASQREIARLLGTAHKDSRAQVMSYSAHGSHGKAWRVVDDALRAAAGRGVRVKLLVANWSTSKHNVADLRALAAVPNVEIKVVTIPPAKQGCIPYARVIHSKYAVVDGKVAWVGTSNWEGGYLDSSRNLEVVVERPELAAKVRSLHDALWASPYAEPLRMTGEYPKVERECEVARPPLPAAAN